MIRGGRCLVFVCSCFCFVNLCVLCICLRPCGELWGVFDGVRILVINWHMWELEISKSFVLSFYEVLQEMLKHDVVHIQVDATLYYNTFVERHLIAL